jgi:hypothetical protein
MQLTLRTHCVRLPHDHDLVGARHARDIRNCKASSRAWPAPTGGKSNPYHADPEQQFFVEGGDDTDSQ